MSNLEERKNEASKLLQTMLDEQGAGLEMINTMLRDVDYTPLQALLDQAQDDTTTLLDLLCNAPGLEHDILL